MLLFVMHTVKAIYPGTFDPLTNGHLDLIARGAKIVDELVVAILRNSEKGTPLFTVPERVEMIQEAVGQFGNVSVATFDGLLVTFAREQKAKAVLRRVAPATTQVAQAPESAAPVRDRFRFAGWELDVAARRLTDHAQRETPLTSGEFDLLRAFVHHPGRVLSRDFLLEQTRGRDAGPFDRTIDVQIGRLRKKIEAEPDDPQIIKSVRGAGYILVSPITTD